MPTYDSCPQCGRSKAVQARTCRPCYDQARARDHAPCSRCQRPKTSAAAYCRQCADELRGDAHFTEKRCTGCGEVKPIEQFGRRRDAMHRSRRSRCKSCENQVAREHYAREREVILAGLPERRRGRREALRLIERRSHFKRIYGLSFEQYDWLLLQQEGRCAICRSETPSGPGKRFVVDHDPGTGRVRGLLCSRCNTALGLLHDDIARLQAAIRYLRRAAQEN
jgi:hypothetical protein